MNTDMGDSLLKHLYPQAFDIVVEVEWDETTKIMITQEEIAAEI